MRKRTNEENDGREKEEGREKEGRDEREREENTPFSPPSSPCVGSKRYRVPIQNASVCTGKTSAC